LKEAQETYTMLKTQAAYVCPQIQL